MYESVETRNRIARLVVLLLFVVLPVGGCGVDPGSAPEDRSADREPQDTSSGANEGAQPAPLAEAVREDAEIFALLANNALIVVEMPSSRAASEILYVARLPSPIATA